AQAKESVSFEAYIYGSGGIPQRFRDAAASRARDGVEVRFTVDSIGGMESSDAFFSTLTDAGGRVAWYHPAKWYTWDRLNNRTHRELLIIDGKVGYTGGAGVADFWYEPTDSKPPWRDTFFKLTGDAVDGLQSVFAENWLEAEGEVLSAPHLFQASPVENGVPCL